MEQQGTYVRRFPESCEQLLEMERLDRFKNDPSSRPECFAELEAVREGTKRKLARLDEAEKTMREYEMSAEEYDRVADKVHTMSVGGLVVEKNRTKGGMSSLAAALQTPAVQAVEAVPPEQQVQTYLQEQRRPRKRNRNNRKYVSADELFQKADALKAELSDLGSAWNAKNDELYTALEVARKQKKYEKRQEYEARNREQRLRELGHPVVKQLDPVHLQQPQCPGTWADEDEEHQREVDFHNAVMKLPCMKMEAEDAAAAAADNGEKKRIPPGGQMVAKDKRVKR